MKKMIKWSAILGTVCCLLGIGVITAGAMMGGVDEIDGYVQRFDDHEFPYGEDIDIIEDIRDHHENGILPEADKALNSVSYDQVRKLKIETGPGEVIILAEDREDVQDTAIRVMGYGIEGVLTYPYEIRQEQDELQIERNHEFRDIVGPFKNRDGDYKNRRMETLYIYIPKNYRFHEVEIEAAASSVEIDEIYADKLDLELMAGELTIGYGAVDAIDAECQAGSMDISLEGKKEQYDYEIKCSVGSITLMGDEEESYSGLLQKEHIDHHAGKKAELECDAGEIVVRFTDTDMETIN